MAQLQVSSISLQFGAVAAVPTPAMVGSAFDVSVEIVRGASGLPVVIRIAASA